MARTLKLTPSESVTIRESTPELLEVEAVYGPAGSPPPKHLHPAQEEHFTVREGEMRAVVGDERHTLREGDEIEIPRGVAHQMWNAGDSEARMRWRTRPAGRTEAWFSSIDALHRDGRVQDD